MKKLLVFGLCTILLNGCVEVESDTTMRLASTLSQVQNAPVKSPSYNHELYSYYSLPYIGKVKETKTGNVFNYNGNKFIMTLDIAGVMNDTYAYDTETAFTVNYENLITSLDGEYTDYQGNTLNYECYIAYSNGYYLTELDTATMVFCGFSDNAYTATDLAGEMLRIARTVEVDQEAVVAAYSNRQTISYSRKKLELFQDIAPEDGAIDELLDTGNAQTHIGDVYEEENYGDDIETGDEITTETPVGEESDTTEEIDENDMNLHDTIE